MKDTKEEEEGRIAFIYLLNIFKQGRNIQTKSLFFNVALYSIK